MIIPPVQSAIAACSLLAALAVPKLPIISTKDKHSADIVFDNFIYFPSLNLNDYFAQKMIECKLYKI